MRRKADEANRQIYDMIIMKDRKFVIVSRIRGYDMAGEKDLLYLIDKIVESDEFWQVNYYLRSMKKAPHGGVMRVFQPNIYLKDYPFQPRTLVNHNPEQIPYFMQRIVGYALTLFNECDSIDYEELLQYCFNGDNWYIGFRLLHTKPEFESINRDGTLLWCILDAGDEITRYFEIDPKYAVYALILCLVSEKAISIKNIEEIQEHEKLKEPYNKYGLTKVDNVEFLRQGFHVGDTYYQYNIFLDPTINSCGDTMPYTFRIITEEIPDKNIFMRCDENLAVPYSEMVSTASVDAQKFHGITLDFKNIETILNNEIIVHIHPTLAHKILMVIKPDSQNQEPFYHIEVEQLWEPTSIRDDIVLATFIHAKYFPQKHTFTHVDFTVNQYTAKVYIAKYQEAVNKTGIPVDKHSDIHYKIWCVEAEYIKAVTWSKLVCATLDEPFREIFLEMFDL